MNVRLPYWIIFFLLLGSIDIQAQITEIEYQLRLNETTCHYDAYLIPTQGTATSLIHRIQFSAQYSIKVPTGSPVNMISSYNPKRLTDNQPIEWKVSSVIKSPAADPEYDYYGIVPVTSPTAYYDPINENGSVDSIKLFSVHIQTNKRGKQGPKIFENGVDPSSAAPGMNGGNFSNGFSLGGTQQIYNGNLPTKESSSVASVVGNSKLTVGEQIQLLPKTGGSWLLQDEHLGKVDHNGLFTAKRSGNVTIIFQPDEGCRSSVGLQISELKGQIGIGTLKPESTAVLDIVSSNKGVLLPRMKEEERKRIVDPAEGLIVFQTDGSPGFYYFMEGHWFQIIGVKQS